MYVYVHKKTATCKKGKNSIDFSSGAKAKMWSEYRLYFFAGTCEIHAKRLWFPLIRFKEIFILKANPQTLLWLRQWKGVKTEAPNSNTMKKASFSLLISSQTFTVIENQNVVHISKKTRDVPDIFRKKIFVIF